MIAGDRSARAGGPTVWGRSVLAAFAAMALGTQVGSAQELSLKPRPVAEELICEPVRTAAEPAGGAVDSGEVERLTNAATQAMILGDLAGALEFLNRALQSDPGAAEAVYLRGRILHQQNRLAEAAESFCRYLALAPAGPSAGEARQRLEEARDLGLGGRLLELFANGVELHGVGRLEEAERAFTDILAARPDAPTALYNRGLIRAERGLASPARSDFRRYLETQPVPSDADAVRRYLGSGSLAGRSTAPSAGTAFAAGLFPGGGQFYTQRPAFGVAVTALTAGLVAGGMLYERTTIRCRDASLGDECPEELIASRETEQPLLLPALGAAAGVAVIAAIEAAVHASRGPSGSARESTGAARLDLDGRLGYDRTGFHLGLLRVSF